MTARHRAAPARWLVWARRLTVPVTAVPLLLLVATKIAFAGDGSKLNQTPGALSWTDHKDTRGIGVWRYEMSLDRGGVTSPSKVLWSYYIDFYWQLYRAGVVFAIWLIDWVMGFGWLPVVATPVLALSKSLTGVVDQFGLVPTFLTIAAIAAVLWMAKGRWALGIFELLLSLLIASLALGVLSHPVEKVAGNDGLIVASRDVGLQLANRLATDGNGSADAQQIRKNTTGMLVDTFIRLPAEVLNFGTVLDGGKCEKVYDKALKGGPYGNGSEIRDAVGDCDSALGDVAANPGPGQAISSLVITPSALFILLFAIILAGAVFLAGISALYQSLKAIVTLVTGLLPGLARGALWQTIADLTMSLLTLVFSIVFLAGYLQIIRGVFTASKPGNGVMATFFFVDVLLVAGIIVYWRGRRSLRRASDRLAQALAARPGPAGQRNSSKLPERPHLGAAVAATTARIQHIDTLRALRRGDKKARAEKAEKKDTGAAPHRSLTGGPGGPPQPSGPGPSRPRGPDPSRAGAGPSRGGSSAKGRIRSGFRPVARAALAAATGGGSTAASAAQAAGSAGRAAHTAVTTAKRAAIAGRLAAASTAGSVGHPHRPPRGH